MKRITVTTVVLLIGLAITNSQETVPNADEVLGKVSDIANIPELNNLNTSALPSLEEATNIFKQKCDENGGPNAFEQAKEAQVEMEQCIKSLISMKELQAEMEEAKPHGDLDVVFKKYCRKSPILRNCVHNFTLAIDPCLDVVEKENKRIILNITDSLLSFVCYKEGDRIALFISAQGPECFQLKQQEIQNCANTTFGGYIPTPNSNDAFPGIESLPRLLFGNKECNDIASLQKCIVPELEKCDEPTPANIVDAIFNFVMKGTPCKDLLTQVPNHSSTLYTFGFLLTIVSIMLPLYII